MLPLDVMISAVLMLAISLLGGNLKGGSIAKAVVEVKVKNIDKKKHFLNIMCLGALWVASLG
jgi:hypothetical protein